MRFLSQRDIQLSPDADGFGNGDATHCSPARVLAAPAERCEHKARSSVNQEKPTLIAQDHKTAAYGIFPMDAQVEEVLQSLNLAGFQSEDICLFLTPAHPIAEGLQTMKFAFSNDLATEASLSDVVAWLSQLGAVVIPGIGFFIASREFLRALMPNDYRSIAVRQGEMMRGLGIPQPDAARYEARVREDATLVFVSCDGSARSHWAREILWRMRAEEVSLLGEYEEGARRKRNGGVGHLVC
jgi:hypothetical protein